MLVKQDTGDRACGGAVALRRFTTGSGTDDRVWARRRHAARSSVRRCYSLSVRRPAAIEQLDSTRWYPVTAATMRSSGGSSPARPSFELMQFPVKPLAPGWTLWAESPRAQKVAP